MLRVRVLETRDLPEVERLHQQAFGQASLKFEDYIGGSGYLHSFVLEEADRINGYLVGQIVFEQVDLHYMAVDPEYYGKGYGQQLLEAFKNKAYELDGEILSLEVRVSNERAIALYKKCHFKSVGIRRQYYSDGEDALIMTHIIKS